MHSITICLALCILLLGCSGNSPFALRQRCEVGDSSGNVYRATDLTPLGAQEAAFDACRMRAPDPNSCQELACGPD
jgi:hypothetical protein